MHRQQQLRRNSGLAAALLSALLVPAGWLLGHVRVADLNPNEAYRKVGSAISMAAVRGQRIIGELKTLRTILQLSSEISAPESSPVPDSENFPRPASPPKAVCLNTLRSHKTTRSADGSWPSVN